MQNYRIVLFYLFFLSTNCLSQSTDSLKPPLAEKLTFFNSKQFEYFDSLNYLDNSLKNFQNYLNKNHLGNSGLAFNDFFYNQTFLDVGFNNAKNNFQTYFYTKKYLLFYDTHAPYTDLFYIIGSKKEQDFKMTFSYNVKQNWNVTANFFRIRSEGFYLRQNTNDNFISLSSNYRSKNNRYNLLCGLMYNYVQNSENGGISDDSVFENGQNLDKRLLAVNLIAAKSSILNRTVFINQYVNFGRKEKDSSLNYIVKPNSHLVFSTSFEDNLLKYEDADPLSGFYSNIYYDSINTYDSMYNFKFENELSWKRLDNNKHRGVLDKLGFGLNTKSQIIRMKQREIDTVLSNIIAGGQFYNTYSDNKLWYKLSGGYCLSGYNAGDYSLVASIKAGVIDSLSFLSVDVSSAIQAPDFIYSRYSSNHFKWNNEFDKVGEDAIGASFLMKKYNFSIAAKWREISNPVYFDNYGISRQYIGSISILSASLKKDFVFQKWHLDNLVQYQYVPDSTVIRLPSFVLVHSLYYANNLFKNAMSIQIGASVFYTSEYFANAYMPATSQFYLQDDKKYGNYPFIDFFINAKIKTVRIFFKIDHVNSGWLGNKYQITPHFPMNDRAFKLGISWRFYD